jgi:hypothetical protein
MLVDLPVGFLASLAAVPVTARQHMAYTNPKQQQAIYALLCRSVHVMHVKQPLALLREIELVLLLLCRAVLVTTAGQTNAMHR